eukprot:TRINITY_DN6712_c0_g1_i1.p1 TRINITY_DN6712_c0_g1~~TRINITY_DN6712_c0_g1_i1.p1  ORF type:complete len:312 (-),score=53.01 TRINITY_DN6712_c0_g1_i1:110-1045(-)
MPGARCVAARPLGAMRRKLFPAVAVAACVAAAAGSWFLVAPSETFVTGTWSGQRETSSSAVALKAAGPNIAHTIGRELPKGWQKKLMKRMPTSRLTTEEIMQRIVTVLIHNMNEKFRDAPMKTLDLMKEIGLRGAQIKSKRFINPALDLLMAQKVILKVKQNPKRWEIHEEYRKYGVPPINMDKRNPWKFCYLLKFKRTTVPKYGPTQGMYRVQDKEFLLERGLPIVSIHQHVKRPDPFAPDADLRLLNLRPPPQFSRPRYTPIQERIPRQPKDKDGRYVHSDWELEQPHEYPKPKPPKIGVNRFNFLLEK